MRIVTRKFSESYPHGAGEVDVPEPDVPAALARCPECGFLFDPAQYAGDWPCCGPRCADAAKTKLRD